MLPIDPMAPLAGMRVLDASRILAGPFCAQTLGDLGAEVIKLERPQVGDDTRTWGPPFVGEWSAYFLSCNRNKKSVTLDLTTPEGAEVLHRLLIHCDVLIENFRAASTEKLGLNPEKLLATNPKLIVCSISGYGRTGPMRDVAGYDFAIQAQSGLMHITGPIDGPPTKVGVALTDVLTGLYAATAILACLRARNNTGHGYAIDLSLFDCALAAQVNMAQAYLSSGVPAGRQGNAHLQIVPYQLFATADGWLVLNVGNDSQWQHFCEAAEVPHLARDERFRTNPDRVRHRHELIPQLEALMRSRTTADWKARLDVVIVPCSEVQNHEQAFRMPQAQHRGMRMTVRDPQGKPVDLVGSPFHITGVPEVAYRHPPRLGEHTAAILADFAGLDGKRIQELRQKGVI